MANNKALQYETYEELLRLTRESDLHHHRRKHQLCTYIDVKNADEGLM
jgi:hypothetical protein